MTSPTFFNRPALEEIQRKALDIGQKKSHDYGRSGDGIAMAGVRGVVVRNLDKQLRCMSLTEPGHQQAVSDEGLRDTLMDMINYCTYAVSLLDGTWGKKPESFKHINIDIIKKAFEQKYSPKPIQKKKSKGKSK